MATKKLIYAKFNFGNIKVGNIATWSTLASDQSFETKYGTISGTCNGCCEHCGHSVDGKRPPCYVFKSYRYPSVINGHARNTIALRQFPDETRDQLINQLARRKKDYAAIRIDQSGEMENDGQHEIMCDVVRSDENHKGYIYTKKYDIVRRNLKKGVIPKNFTHLLSVWHDQGIAEYNSMKSDERIKAFVYMDKNADSVNGWDASDYEAHGIHIDTMCMAYGKDGKMNHAITCDKCRKCFDSRYKVIGTWAH